MSPLHSGQVNEEQQQADTKDYVVLQKRETKRQRRETHRPKNLKSLEFT